MDHETLWKLSTRARGLQDRVQASELSELTRIGLTQKIHHVSNLVDRLTKPDKPTDDKHIKIVHQGIVCDLDEVEAKLNELGI